MTKLYQERTYRCLAAPEGLERFQVKIKESDLLVFAERRLDSLAYRALGQARGEIERHIERHGEFARSLEPCDVAQTAPQIIRDMADSARSWDVGPMASVAGAGETLVSEDALSHAGMEFDHLERRELSLKGRSAPVAVRVMR